jgi:hypothetical protein
VEAHWNWTLWVPSVVQLKTKGVLKPEGTLQRFVGDDESGGILKIVREREREKRKITMEMMQKTK